MKLFKIIFNNTLRHKLRTGLTIIGIAVAVLAFCLLRTLIHAWYAGVEASAANRLITRNAISLIFPPASFLSGQNQTDSRSDGCHLCQLVWRGLY